MKGLGDMSLNKDIPVQLHYQLANKLREFIHGGHWTIGDLFPTDREIIEKYDVSGTTVRRAVMQLVNEGWLERKAGKGTFIKKEPLKEHLGQLTGFFEEMRNQGFKPSADIISASLIDVSEALLKENPALKAFQAEKLVLFEKLHKFNDKPLVYVKSFWRQEYGEQLLGLDLSAEGTYEIANKRLGLNFSKADETIAADLATHKEAEFLQVKKNFPVLRMERMAYAEDILVEFSYNVYRADRYRYHVVLYKDRPVGEMILVP